jgi:hypothetical protein
VLAAARAVRGGWAYFDAMGDPWAFIGPCRDVVGAAERVDGMLKHRMYPDTFSAPS